MHVANRIEHRRPIALNETPTLRVRAADLRDHPRGRQFDVVAEAHAGGEVVWVARSTYLRVDAAGSGAKGKDDERRQRPAPPAPQAIFAVGGDVGRRYAAVSGDRNPIHLHGLSARLFGQSSAIAHGMWLKARCLAALQPSLPDAFAVEVAFKRPVPLPSEVGFSTHTGDAATRSFALHGTRTPVPHLEGRIESP